MANNLLTRPLTDKEVREAEQAAKENVPSFGKQLGLARDLHSISASMYDYAGEDIPQHDQEWVPTDEEWDQATEGIPAKHIDALSDAWSSEDLQRQSERLRLQVEQEQKLASAGWSGIGASLLATMFDETAIATSIATEGLATPFVFASKLNRLQRVGRAALVGGGTTAAMEVGTLPNRETKGISDVAWAGAFGALFTAPWGWQAGRMTQEGKAFSKIGREELKRKQEQLGDFEESLDLSTESTDVPQESTDVPQETTDVPQETPDVPQETADVPGDDMPSEGQIKEAKETMETYSKLVEQVNDKAEKEEGLLLQDNELSAKLDEAKRKAAEYEEMASQPADEFDFEYMESLSNDLENDYTELQELVNQADPAELEDVRGDIEQMLGGFPEQSGTADGPESAVMQAMDSVGAEDDLVPLDVLRTSMQGMSRDQQDQILYSLEKQDKIELVTGQEVGRLTDEQFNAGIEQEIGGPIVYARKEISSISDMPGEQAAKSVDGGEVGSKINEIRQRKSTLDEYMAAFNKSTETQNKAELAKKSASEWRAKEAKLREELDAVHKSLDHEQYRRVELEDDLEEITKRLKDAEDTMARKAEVEQDRLRMEEMQKQTKPEPAKEPAIPSNKVFEQAGQAAKQTGGKEGEFVNEVLEAAMDVPSEIRAGQAEVSRVYDRYVERNKGPKLTLEEFKERLKQATQDEKIDMVRDNQPASQLGDPERSRVRWGSDHVDLIVYDWDARSSPDGIKSNVLKARNQPAKETDMEGKSAGAASTEGTYSTESVIPDWTAPDTLWDGEGSESGKPLRIDLFKKGSNATSQTARWLNRILMVDPMGSGRGTGATRETPAAAKADRYLVSYMAKFDHPSQRLFKEFLKESNRSSFAQFDPRVRRAFFEEVTDYMRSRGSVNVSKQAKELGENIKALYRDILEKGQEVGLEGLADIDIADDWYSPRLWSGERFRALNEDERFNSEHVLSLIEKAIRKADDTVPDKVSRAMAKATYDRFLSKGYGIDMEFSKAMEGRDLDTLDNLLSESEIDFDTRQMVREWFEAAETREQTGRANHAKERMKLDEETQIVTANGDVLKIRDLLENDAEKLYGHYMRQMTGQIAFTEKLREHGWTGNVAPNREYRKITRQIRNEVGTDDDEVIEGLDMVYNMINGKPPREGMNTSWHSAGRILSGFNFTRLMGQVGFAQTAELGSTMGYFGVQTVLKNMPAMRSLFRDAKSGKASHALMRELEEMVGVFGAEHVMFRPTYRMEEYGMEAGRKSMRNIEYGMDNAKQLVGTLSGMRHITNGLQRLAAVSAAQRFMKLSSKAIRGLKDLDQYSDNELAEKLTAMFADGDMARFRADGLSEEMLARVLRQISKHRKQVKTNGGSRRYEIMGLNDWDDYKARDAFADSLHRMTYRAIQRNLPGELPGSLYSSTVMQILFQFRSFVLGAWSKQLLHNVNMRDARMFGVFTGGMLFGTLGYMSQQYLNSFGREDREEFLETRFDPVEIAKSGFQRAGWASLLPGILDTAVPLTPFLDEPMFSYGRSTGLATDWLNGIPTVDLINKSMDAMSSIKAVRSDYRYSDDDFDSLWKVMMLNNVTGIRNVGELIKHKLPSQSSYSDGLEISDYFD